MFSARRRRNGPSGRILAIKLGVNPNSSSLGADITFLLLGAGAMSVLTPVVSALLRGFWRGPDRMTPSPEHVSSDVD